VTASYPSTSVGDWAEYAVPHQAPEIELLRAHFAGHAYERHSHQAYAIGVTEAGVQAFNCRGAARASLAGMVMAFNPDEPHDGHAADAQGFTYRMLYISPELVRRVIQAAREERAAALPYARTPVIEDRELAAHVSALHRALAEGAPRLDCDALLDAAILCFAARHADRGAITQGAAAPGEIALRRVRDFLHDAPLGEDIAADTLARLAGMSRFHLWRAFRRRYGLPPHAYRMQRRLAAARDMLVQGEAPAAVAAALGFADQSHLHKRFKGAYGITPGQFAAAAATRKYPDAPAERYGRRDDWR